MQIVAFNKEERERWKHTSMLTFTIGRFGNSDPKKYPSSIKKYMPGLWADDEIDEEDPLIAAARNRRLQQKVNGR